MELEPLLKELSKQENVEALREIVEKLPTISYTIRLLDQLANTGALETLLRMACMVASLKEMLSDEMVAGLSSLASSAIDVIAKTKSPVVQGMLSAIADHPKEFEEELKKTKITGLWSLIGALKDPEVQEGMSLLIVIMKMLGKYAKKASRVFTSPFSL